MLIRTILLGLSLACENGNFNVEFPEILPEDLGVGSVAKLTQKSHPFMKQLSEEIKNELTSGIMNCLVTRRNPMDKNDQSELGKTQWFIDWNRHCGELLDPACPGRMGECWAMGVLMCRKNCDAKYMLRGNRKKFKRCIYRELKLYEKAHPDSVDPTCSVLDEDGKLMEH